MTEKTLTTENIRPALDALRGELAPWPVVAKKQDRLNNAQLNAANSGITSSLVAQIIANTAAIRALESAITGTGLRALVVSSLPAIGTQGILYIVPVTTYDPGTDADVVNYSNEYIWIVAPDAPVTEGYYEQVGQTGIVINNGQLTITVNGTSVGTFTANQSGDTTAAITVPTNADYVDRTTAQTIAGIKTFSSTIEGTASKAIADEDGNSFKTSYGKLAGANVWTNVQDYKFPIRFANDSYASGTPSANIFYTTIQWGGYVNNTWTTSFNINNAIRTNGYSDTSFRTYSQTSNTLTGFVHETNADASDIAFRPIVNGTHKLGSSSYQWSSVYAQRYYYNGTAWGLDKENTWTATQNVKGAPPALNLQSTNIQRGVAPASNSNINLYGKDLNNIELYRLLYRASPTGERRLWLGVNDNYLNGTLDPTGTSTWNSLNLYLRADGKAETTFSADLLPETNNTYNLGSSSYQWKSVYSQTYFYNGVAWGLDKNNVWTATQSFKDSAYTQGVSVTDRKQDIWKVTDSTDTAFGTWEAIQYTNNKQGFRLNTTNKYKNGDLDPTGNSVTVHFEFLQRPSDGASILKWTNGFIDNSVYPLVTNTYTLGNAFYQWASVYAQTYYYNGTAWGLDKANTWTGLNTFTNDVCAVTSQSVPITENPSAEIRGNNFRFIDNARFWGEFVPVWDTSGSFRIELGISNWSTTGNQGYWTVATKISKDFGTLDFYTSHAIANLGTSTNKWKTINGINPGALSLPSFSSSDPTMLIWADLDTTNWLLDGTGNAVSIALDGYVYVSVSCGTDGYVVITEGQYGYPNCFYMSTGVHIAGTASALLPVRKGIGITVYCKGTSIFHARFFPMQGNV